LFLGARPEPVFTVALAVHYLAIILGH
jgi:hypothetical protein